MRRRRVVLVLVLMASLGVGGMPLWETSRAFPTGVAAGGENDLRGDAWRVACGRRRAALRICRGGLWMGLASRSRWGSWIGRGLCYCSATTTWTGGAEGAKVGYGRRRFSNVRKWRGNGLGGGFAGCAGCRCRCVSRVGRLARQRLTAATAGSDGASPLQFTQETRCTSAGVADEPTVTSANAANLVQPQQVFADNACRLGHAFA